MALLIKTDIKTYRKANLMIEQGLMSD